MTLQRSTTLHLSCPGLAYPGAMRYGRSMGYSPFQISERCRFHVIMGKFEAKKTIAGFHASEWCQSSVQSRFWPTLFEP